MSEFPATELDKPASQSFVRAEVADLRTEMRTEFAALRGEIHTSIATLDASFSERLRQQTMWMFATLMTGIGLATAIATLIAHVVN